VSVKFPEVVLEYDWDLSEGGDRIGVDDFVASELKSERNNPPLSFDQLRYSISAVLDITEFISKKIQEPNYDKIMIYLNSTPPIDGVLAHDSVRVGVNNAVANRWGRNKGISEHER
jgi:hypothetical protein